jgi:hypothetical protein
MTMCDRRDKPQSMFDYQCIYYLVINACLISSNPGVKRGLISDQSLIDISNFTVSFSVTSGAE